MKFQNNVVRSPKQTEFQNFIELRLLCHVVLVNPVKIQVNLVIF